MDLVDRLTVWCCCGLSVDEETSCYKEKVNENPNPGNSLLQTKTELVNLPGQKVKFQVEPELIALENVYKEIAIKYRSVKKQQSTIAERERESGVRRDRKC